MRVETRFTDWDCDSGRLSSLAENVADDSLESLRIRAIPETCGILRTPETPDFAANRGKERVAWHARCLAF